MRCHRVRSKGNLGLILSLTARSDTLRRRLLIKAAINLAKRANSGRRRSAPHGSRIVTPRLPATIEQPHFWWDSFGFISSPRQHFLLTVNPRHGSGGMARPGSAVAWRKSSALIVTLVCQDSFVMGRVFVSAGNCAHPGCGWGGGGERTQPKPFAALLWLGGAPGIWGHIGSSTRAEGQADPAADPLAGGVSKQSTTLPAPSACIQVLSPSPVCGFAEQE